MADDSYDVIVIGAGAGGLTAAAGCAMYGLRTALIERDRMGGECLNTGCVPSKALLAAAARAHAVRDATRFGVLTDPPRVDFAAVRAHVRRAIETIAPHDSVERLQGFGVEVVSGEARLLDRHRVAANGRTLTALRIVLATGSRPALPPILGLKDVRFLTNESVWDLDALPTQLAIIGAGPVGMELGQAFRRLGAAVTIVANERPLGREDEGAADIVLRQLEQEGVRFIIGDAVQRIESTPDGVRLVLAGAGEIDASHLLVAAGRSAVVEGLGLDSAGVSVGPNGITVDRRGRTSVTSIFAVGDCRDGPRLTHAAGNDGSVAVQNIALGVPARSERRNLPRAVYTDPELAQVGYTEAEATQRFASVEVDLAPFADDDRAVAEGETAGFVKLIRARGRTIGVTIVGAHAGDLLLPWSQALAGKASRFRLASSVIAYPTRSERSKEAAFASLRPTLFHPAVKMWARLLARTRRMA